ncbi:MAG: adenylate kinase [Candidatus Iainarchaeum archaeon]|uniref:Adenylate kinase n=1 Tax=Candidatus Iainarchaeum sp. TaxID=3101447 RepID=A0A497JGF6_9ARCH|nr:MAG: adenylate kinase [Candidatus Diapherotrites archaeon]
MILVFFGPPGSGKGTVAQFLQEKFGYVQLSTGDVVRAIAKEETPLGKKIAKILKQGALLDDKTMKEILVEELKKEKYKGKTIIFDGYPRTLQQAKDLEEILKNAGSKLTAAIYFDVADKEVVRRLSARLICPKCNKIYGLENPPKKDKICDKCKVALIQRNDDRPEVVKERLRVYKQKTKPLIEFYKEKGLLYVLDANRSIEQTRENIIALLEKIKSEQNGRI